MQQNVCIFKPRLHSASRLEQGEKHEKRLRISEKKGLSFPLPASPHTPSIVLSSFSLSLSYFAHRQDCLERDCYQSRWVYS